MERPGRYRRIAAIAVVALLALAAIATAVMVVPGVLVAHDLAGASVAAPDRLRAISDTRAQLLQIIGGLVLVLGAYATFRRVRINEEELRATRDGQVTERFTRAIEQLGSPNADVRIGAIYALARIARNSPDDRDAVIATLSAFVRGHSPWPPRLPEQPGTDVALTELPTLGTRNNDVQCVVSVLGQLPKTRTNDWIRMPHADLRRARMWRLSLDRALLGSSNLRGARLWGSSLVGTDFGKADLRDTDLTHADLRGAILWGADLRGANLTGVQLDGALVDADTRWPDGFDPAAAGVVTATAEVKARQGMRHP